MDGELWIWSQNPGSKKVDQLVECKTPFSERGSGITALGYRPDTHSLFIAGGSSHFNIIDIEDVNAFQRIDYKCFLNYVRSVLGLLN